MDANGTTTGQDGSDRRKTSSAAGHADFGGRIRATAGGVLRDAPVPIRDLLASSRRRPLDPSPSRCRPRSKAGAPDQIPKTVVIERLPSLLRIRLYGWK